MTLVSCSLVSPPIWAEDKASPKNSIYYSFPEPFTINFSAQSKQKVRYLQIKVAIMADDQKIIDNAELNLPMLQDGLRTLFTEQSLESVSTVSGRQTMQTEALKLINTLLKQETGEGKVGAIYFTGFILQ